MASSPTETGKKYSISDLAKEFDVTTRTIRHYEEIGLLAPERHGQTRLYRPSDRTKLKLILRGKRLGFTLDQSRAIIEMYDPQTGNVDQLRSLIEGIHEQRARLRQQIVEIKLLLEDLDDAEEMCQNALNRR